MLEPTIYIPSRLSKLVTPALMNDLRCSLLNTKGTKPGARSRREQCLLFFFVSFVFFVPSW
jgi:hypothetical protein